jgi:hypothetical protein
MPVDKRLQSAPENAFPGLKHRLARSESAVRAAVLLSVALILGGCHKSEPAGQTTATPPAADQDQTTPPPAPAYTPPAADTAPTIAASPDGGADLRQLNHVYISWIVQNRRRAKDFDDFVASSGVQVPPAPAGKKYAIDKNGFIALVNQ